MVLEIIEWNACFLKIKFHKNVLGTCLAVKYNTSVQFVKLWHQAANIVYQHKRNLDDLHFCNFFQNPTFFWYYTIRSSNRNEWMNRGRCVISLFSQTCTVNLWSHNFKKSNFHLKCYSKISSREKRWREKNKESSLLTRTERASLTWNFQSWKRKNRKKNS